MKKMCLITAAAALTGAADEGSTGGFAPPRPPSTAKYGWFDPSGGRRTKIPRQKPAAGVWDFTKPCQKSVAGVWDFTKSRQKSVAGVRDFPNPCQKSVAGVRDFPNPCQKSVAGVRDFPNPCQKSVAGVRDFPNPCQKSAARVRDFPNPCQKTVAGVRDFPNPCQKSVAGVRDFPNPCHSFFSRGGAAKTPRFTVHPYIRKETGAVENLIVVKEARTKLNNIYVRIRNRINSEVDDEEANPPLEALITQLNLIAKRFNTIVAKRDAAGKNGGGEVDGEEGAGSEEGDEA